MSNKVSEKIKDLIAFLTFSVVLAALSKPLIDAGVGVAARGESGLLTAAMVFALMGPIVLMLYSGLGQRLIGFLVSIGIALSLRLVGELIESGRYGAGMAALVLLLGACALLYAVLQHNKAKQARCAANLADEARTLIGTVTKTLKARYSQPQFKPQQRNAPIHALSLAENLALGVTSQSVACPEADEVGAEILQGLYDVRNDLKDNPVIDPQSYAAAILDLYLVSLAKLFQTHGVTAKVRKAPGASSHEEFRILRERTPASDQPVNLRVVTPNAA